MPAELLQLPPRMLRLGMTLPYDIYDAAGKLMFARGQVLRDSPLVRSLIDGGAWVRPEDTAEYQKALAHRMDTLMHQDAVLTEIANAEVQFRFDPPASRVELPPREAWADLLLHTHLLLREAEPADFEPRLARLRDRLLARARSQPDATLLQLVYESGQSFQDYSARHALLTLLLAELVAAQLSLNAEQRSALHGAALTMNYGAGPAHDRLAQQAEPASLAQRQALNAHGEHAARRLQALGVRDPAWLEAVRLHHDAGPGPLGTRAPGEQLARLLRRIDIYGARLAPRRTRTAMSGAAAARAVYLDENQQPDEAGAALIKAVGLYPPGSVVRLADGEVGLVFKRGYSASEPLVAALIGKSGTPLSHPVPRDTRQAAHAITASLAPQELKLRVNLDALLKL
ncbi:MAG: phosphohydrolase [Roseateles depolymerans]|uniref:Phosphohydrolase n=1 Tax=Roseateles depolymerans TaxID=76731 RepID=A0A2W5FW80_9BURK|nr:MAG: phosphohydrolase [Roseateles depolymerans]